MMKDYYKILGVEEGASGEEIRARWAELIKHYHLDLGETGEENEKAREINEAYEILKNESARFEFDLERAWKRSVIKKKAHSAKERRMNIRKIMLPAGILVLFLIVGLMSFARFHVAAPPKSEVLDKMAKGIEKETASQMPPVRNESGEKAQKKVTEGIKKEEIKKEEIKKEEIKKEGIKKEEIKKEEIKKEGLPRKSEEIVSVSSQGSPSAVKRELDKKEESSQKIVPKEEAPVKVEEEGLAKEEPKPVIEPVPQGVTKTEAPVRVEKEVPKEVPREVPKEATGATLHPGKKLAIKTEEEKWLAKEEEVKQFFSSYIDRYHRKDIDGFLSFFSSQAVQNQKDGLKEIRSIYTKFFDQSQELRYRVEGMKVEIYENAVEVKARFRVDQTLKRRGEEKVWTGTIRWVLVKEDGALKIISLNYQNQKSP
jgi:curved DNA-binding protein CbpA